MLVSNEFPLLGVANNPQPSAMRVLPFWAQESPAVVTRRQNPAAKQCRLMLELFAPSIQPPLQMVAVSHKRTNSQPCNRILHRVAECLYRAEPSQVYYAVLKINGRQIRRSLKTTEREYARRRLDELRQKIRRINPTADELAVSNFEEMSKLWLDSVRGRLKSSSYRRRETIVRLLLPRFGNKALRNITRMEVERWAATRSCARAASTFNQDMATVRMIFDYAITHGLLMDNPAAHIERRRQRRTTIAIPSREQFKAMLAQMRSNEGKPSADRSATFAEFLAYSGCRLREAASVQWKDADFAAKTLLITGGEQGTKNHESRVIPMFPPLERLLLSIRQALPAPPKSTEKALGIAEAKVALANACRKLGYPLYLHHAMRHFFCSNVIEAGVDFKTIAGWLGHKDGGVLVCTTYGHLRQEHSAEMAKRVTFDATAGEAQ